MEGSVKEIHLNPGSLNSPTVGVGLFAFPRPACQGKLHFNGLIFASLKTAFNRILDLATARMSIRASLFEFNY